MMNDTLSYSEANQDKVLQDLHDLVQNMVGWDDGRIDYKDFVQYLKEEYLVFKKSQD